MKNAVVAMFCGPHNEGTEFPYVRIDRSIAVALERGLPLLIAGDAHRGRDLEYFRDYAQGAGVIEVVIEPLYDPRASTLADAQMVAEWLRGHHAERGIQHVLLVTDLWHMFRAMIMLQGEINKRLPVGTVQSIPAAAFGGPRPPEDVILGEIKGARDYLDGTYGPDNRAYDSYGKPANGSDRLARA